MISYNNLGPKHDARTGHHEHSPDEGPVFGFLGVIEARKLRLLGREAEIVGEILPRAPDIVQCGEQIARQATSFARDYDIEQVIDAYGYQNHGRDAVQQAAHVLAESKHGGEPGVRELEREAGKNQQEETRQQRGVLDSEAQRHARDKCSLQLTKGDDLGAPENKVVQQHAANHGEDHAEIKLANPTNGFAADVR